MKIKKAFSKLVLSVLSIILFCTSVPVYAGTKTAIDAILVLDTSNSMYGSDPQRISIEGAKLFVDMLEAAGSKVAVVGFNGQISYETPFYSINSFADKDIIKNSLDSISYSGQTDIGLALVRADEYIATLPKDSSNPVVIMFTDGYIETTGSRTEQMSLDDVDRAILSANGNYPIYTIGLNASSRVDQPLLEKIADETGAQNYMTSNAADLPDIFNQIFANHTNSNVINLGTLTGDSENYNTIDINIPNANVAEANITILSDNPVTDVILTDPSGNNQNSNVYYATSNKYSLMKIIKPARGTWKLSVKGITGDKIKINLLYNYDLILTAGYEGTPQVGGSFDIIGHFTDSDGNASPIGSNINTDAIFIDVNGNEIFRSSMTNDGTKFILPYSPSESELRFYLRSAGDGFYRESQEVHISVLPDSTATATEPAPTAETTPAPTLTPKPPADIEPKTFADYLTSPAGLISLGGIALILIIILIVFLIKRNKLMSRPFTGELRYFITKDGTMGPRKNTDLRLYKGTVTLDKLIETGENSENLSMLNRITLRPAIKGKQDILIVANTSGYKILTNRETEPDFELSMKRSMTVIGEENTKLEIVFDDI